MNIADIELLAQVAETGSFAAVARLRDADPSWVSRHVARIERALGLRVFQRSTRSLTLTEAGASFLNRAQSIPAEFEDARQAALGASRTVSGTLRLTASHGFTQMRIVPLMAPLKTAFPQLRINLVASDANLDLHAEGIDLAVRFGAEVHGDYVTSRLFDVHYRVVASPDWDRRSSIQAPGDLAGIDCLAFALPGYRSTWRFLDPEGAALDVPIQAGIEASSALVLRQMALEGLGPSLLAEWCVADDLAAGRLVDLFPDYRVTATGFQSAAWLVYPSRAYLPAKTRVAADFFKSRLSGAA